MSDALRQTVAHQQRAADPARSAFVSANAGSGKTRVLTSRVARLLLAGVRPDSILCITFTKAAAAEMAERLFDMLGEWALADDDTLRGKLIELDPSLDQDTSDYGRARRLFAQALETPGGLKIQTIHSFCENVLHRFPLEAGVAPGFSVLDDAANAALHAEAIAIALRKESAPTALSQLSQTGTTGEQAKQLLETCLRSAATRTAMSAPDYHDQLSAWLNVDPHRTASAYERATVEALIETGLGRLISALLAGGKNASKFGAQLDAAMRAPKPEQFSLIAGVLLTKGGAIRQKLIDKTAEKAAPESVESEARLKQIFSSGLDQVRGAHLAAAGGALSILVRSAAEALDKLKGQHAALDFDDLITHARRLLGDDDRSAWVMYKLDQGLEHILLDEAQDTSPAAWQVIEGPLTEFFAGAGVFRSSGKNTKEKERPARTFFAVGDQKQSIYSFQGADAALFAEKSQDLGKRIAAAAPFENIPLSLSFRTVGPILNFVDALFEDKNILDGVSTEYPLRHGVHRDGQAGFVELWPLTPHDEKPELVPWDAPMNALSIDSPPRKLTQRVASTIRSWLDEGTPNSAGTRAIEPKDIMILVQSRGTLFHEMIKALSAAGVPVAGADKLSLLDDPGVKDLMSFARAVLFEGDDLSLGEVLKGPFFKYTDDDLFDLAYDRPGSMLDALRTRAKSDPATRAVLDEIETARRIARHDGPYAFFSHLLETGTPTGRERLISRLGPPSREPIEAFIGLVLDYETGATRSLTRFLDWITKAGAEVSRDAEQTDNVVRVMTVHKSKGLEADIVFLLDAQRRPRFRDTLITTQPTDDRQLPFWRIRDSEPDIVAETLMTTKRLQLEEYRRLLYVAATRARDRLYICGVVNKNEGTKADLHESSWHAIASVAMGKLPALEAGELWGLPVLQYGEVPVWTKSHTAKATSHNEGTPPADYLSSPAPSEREKTLLSPSRLADITEAFASGGDEIVAQSRQLITPVADPRTDGFFRGRVLHRLLELLPACDEDKRPQTAERLLARLAPETPDKTRAIWRDEVLSVLKDPAFAPVFLPVGRAEVSVAGNISVNGQTYKISGQIDRLIQHQDEVLIVDYKTNRPPPLRLEETPQAYLAQMGAYAALVRRALPGLIVKSALLWTYAPKLIALPDDLIDGAFHKSLRAHEG